MKFLPVALCFLAIGVIALLFLSRFLSSGGPVVDLEKRQPASASEPDAGANGRLRFCVATIVSAEETFGSYRELVRRVGQLVGRDAVLVMRPSYLEVREALAAGTVDVAMVCTGTYVYARQKRLADLLVTPKYLSGPSYQGLIIVPSASTAKTVDDLRGRVMAFTDPESLTGRVLPTAMLLDRDLRPRDFFGKILFTGSHDLAIQAMASGVADAAAVNSLVLGRMLQSSPTLSSQVRTIWRSECFGNPPVLVPKTVSQELRNALKGVFLSLHDDSEGRGILARLGIEQFVEPDEEVYESAFRLHERVRLAGEDWRP